MILNLTQHPATPEQIAMGVADLQGPALVALKRALTFSDVPSAGDISERACTIVALAFDGDNEAPAQAMIGGAGYLMPALETELRRNGIEPLHAFTRRETVETVAEDGTVTKTAIFRHAGWVRTE